MRAWFFFQAIFVLSQFHSCNAVSPNSYAKRIDLSSQIMIKRYLNPSQIKLSSESLDLSSTLQIIFYILQP